MINPLHPVALSVYIANIDISNLYFHKDISPRSLKNWGRIGAGISQIEHLPQVQPHYSAPPPSHGKLGFIGILIHLPRRL